MKIYNKFPLLLMVLLQFNGIYNVNAMLSDVGEYELDFSGKTIKSLHEIPMHNFAKSNIRLTNVTEKKFFDTNNMKSSSISDKLGEAIRKAHVKKVEYSYSSDAYNFPKGVDSWMSFLAEGKQVVVIMNGEKFKDKGRAPEIAKRNREAAEIYQITIEEPQRVIEREQEARELRRRQNRQQRIENFQDSNGPTFGMENLGYFSSDDDD